MSKGIIYADNTGFAGENSIRAMPEVSPEEAELIELFGRLTPAEQTEELENLQKLVNAAANAADNEN